MGDDLFIHPPFSLGDWSVTEMETRELPSFLFVQEVK